MTTDRPTSHVSPSPQTARRTHAGQMEDELICVWNHLPEGFDMSPHGIPYRYELRRRSGLACAVDPTPDPVLGIDAAIARGWEVHVGEVITTHIAPKPPIAIYIGCTFTAEDDQFGLTLAAAHARQTAVYAIGCTFTGKADATCFRSCVGCTFYSATGQDSLGENECVVNCHIEKQYKPIGSRAHNDAVDTGENGPLKKILIAGLYSDNAPAHPGGTGGARTWQINDADLEHLAIENVNVRSTAWHSQILLPDTLKSLWIRDAYFPLHKDDPDGKPEVCEIRTRTPGFVPPYLHIERSDFRVPAWFPKGGVA